MASRQVLTIRSAAGRARWARLKLQQQTFCQIPRRNTSGFQRLDQANGLLSTCRAAVAGCGNLLGLQRQPAIFVQIANEVLHSRAKLRREPGKLNLHAQMVLQTLSIGTGDIRNGQIIVVGTVFRPLWSEIAEPAADRQFLLIRLPVACQLNQRVFRLRLVQKGTQLLCGHGEHMELQELVLL